MRTLARRLLHRASRLKMGANPVVTARPSIAAIPGVLVLYAPALVAPTIPVLFGLRDSLHGLGLTAIESSEKRFTDLALWPIQEIRDFGHDSVQGANMQIPVPWHCHTVPLGRRVRARDSHVTSLRSGHTIPVVLSEQPCDLLTGEVARNLHTAIATSLTRCNRMTLGTSPSSK